MTRSDGRGSERTTVYLFDDMKNSFFYWNWLARVAKASNTQRNVAMNTTTTKSKMNGKTVILAVATIIAVALTTQTTGPTAQSAEMPKLPDLPDPGPVPEPAFPPVPPGTFTCFEYYNAVRLMLDNQQSNFYQAIDRAYKAKCKPFYDKIDSINDEIDDHRDQYLKKIDQWIALLKILYPNTNAPRITSLQKEIENHRKEIEKLQEQISKLFDDLGKIAEWRKKMIEWANEKHRKENEALEAHYGDCLDNESDND